MTDQRPPHLCDSIHALFTGSPNPRRIVTQGTESVPEKFGHEPGPHDPVFFDADFDEPTVINPEKYQTAIIEAMRKAGVREAVIHA
jgi:hypothetical protein